MNELPANSKDFLDVPGGRIELEMGVPIPGMILPASQWVQTALKRLPPSGPLDWTSLFGRSAPVVLDIGCGNGRFAISSAVRRPAVDHIGIDLLPVVIRYATRRGNQRGLANLRFAVCDGYHFLKDYVAPNSMSEIHIYHPQPFKDPKERNRRLLSPAFVQLVHRSLKIGGKLYLQSDNRGYWQQIRTAVSRAFDWQEKGDPWEEDPYGRSRREFIAIQKRLPIFRAVATRIDHLPPMDGTDPI
jgi:tRNA (guanine-N7-)-methyltransferase